MRTLDQWIDYIQTLHHRQIDLSLERVHEVYLRLITDGAPFSVITIAGTNGKGSTAEILSSIYCAAGVCVGKYSSPHLVRFNERYLINGSAVDDRQLLAAFEKVERVRGDIPITFFEFGTLIAIELFRNNNVDIAIMEVGLGGRQDAVNILDPDVAIVTSISKDHTAWLGDTIDDISYEKIGIARAETPCIIGIEKPSKRMTDYCDEIKANSLIVGQDFSYKLNGELNQKTDELTWQWHNSEIDYQNLPLPFGQTGVQLSNASLAIQAIECMQNVFSVESETIRQGFIQASLAARCQIVSQDPLIVLDVSHNVSSVQRLVDFVSKQAQGRKAGSTQDKFSVVCGMLKDKEIAASLSLVSPMVDQWYLASIEHERGSDSDHLSEIVKHIEPNSQIKTYANVREAYKQAVANLKKCDTLVVFGSFFIAGDILKFLSETDNLSN